MAIFQVLIALSVLLTLVVGDASSCTSVGTCTALGRRFLIAGNWKMNTDLHGATELTSGIIERTKKEIIGDVEIALFPPYVFIRDVVKILENDNTQGIKVGAQSVYFETKGAYTAAVSAPMVKSVGAELVLVGHSERRSVFHESDADINRSLKQVLAHGMVPMLCVGETLSEYEEGLNREVIASQLEQGLQGVTAEQAGRLVVAYEPVWAIGTGKVATPEIAQSVHSFIRGWLRAQYGEAVSAAVRVLYGGSVSPESAEALLRQADVDGALVGGASLKADSFAAIVGAAVSAQHHKELSSSGLPAE